MNTSSGSIPMTGGSSYERLTFNLTPAADRSVREDEYYVRDRAGSEPRNWGYTGLLAFTAVLLLRPQDHLAALEPLHLAEICALIGIGPMILHRLGHRLPGFRVTVETVALMVFGAVMLATAPFSIWPGGAIDEITNSYLKIVIVFVLMMNVLTTTERLERLMWIIVVCTGVIAGLSVLNYVRGINLVEGGRLAGPVGGIFGNPNDLAMNMTSFLPAAIVIALSGRQPAGKRLVAAADRHAHGRDDHLHEVARGRARARGRSSAPLPCSVDGCAAASARSPSSPCSSPRRFFPMPSGRAWCRSSTKNRTSSSPARARRAERSCRRGSRPSSNTRSRASASASSRTTTRPSEKSAGSKHTTC